MQAFERFEKEWSNYSGCDYVVGCSSGTAALHLACEAARNTRVTSSPKTTEVIVPDYAMIACARAVSLAGLKPKFVDCDHTLCLDVNKLEQAITDDTAAIMAVHTYGRECDMSAIHDLAAKYGLYVIEDLAEAHLTHPHPNTHAACWSFYKNKIIYGEEGGAVAFLEKEDAEQTRSRRSLGFTQSHDYWHIPRGHNYRLSNAHASLILHTFPQITLYARKVEKDRRIQIDMYDSFCPEAWQQGFRKTPWVYDFRIPNMTVGKQKQIVELLRYKGIEARYGFRPLSLQPEYIQRTYPEAGPATMGLMQEQLNVMTRACRAAREVIYLPLGQSAPKGFNSDTAREIFTTIQACLM